MHRSQGGRSAAAVPLEGEARVAERRFNCCFAVVEVGEIAMRDFNDGGLMS